MNKPTSEIVKDLGLTDDFRTFYNKNKDCMVNNNLTDMLGQLLESSGMKKSTVFRNAEISEAYGYQIFSGARYPERKKLICIAIAMELDIEKTQTLLRCAGYSPLYVKVPFDSIVLYGMHKKMSVIDINTLLFEYTKETLC